MSRWNDLVCPRCGVYPNGNDVELIIRHFDKNQKHGSWLGYSFNCCVGEVTIRVETRERNV